VSRVRGGLRRAGRAAGRKQEKRGLRVFRLAHNSLTIDKYNSQLYFSLEGRGGGSTIGRLSSSYHTTRKECSLRELSCSS